MWKQAATRTDVLTIGALVILAAFGAGASRIQVDAIAALVPAVVLLTVLLQLATAALIRADEPDGKSSAGIVLTLGFLLSAAAGIAVLTVEPALPGLQPLLPGAAHSAGWLALAGHAYLAGGAIIYVWIRARDIEGAVARKRALIAGVLMFAVVSATAIAGGGIVVALGLCAFGAVRLATLREASEIERAFAVTLAAMTVDLALTALAGGPYTVGWAVGRLIVLLGSAIVFSAAFTPLLRTRDRLRETDTALARTSRRAERIRALWRVASSDSATEAEHVQAVLDAGRMALRVDHPMFGMISHIENDDVVIDTISWSGSGRAHQAAIDYFVPGTHFSTDMSVAGELVSGGRTRTWNDIDAGNAPSDLIRLAGWTNVVAAAFQIGRVTHLLVFGTPELLFDEPFAEDDVAFVDVLASQVSHRFYEREQLARIRYQMEHDALTGLLNRTEFRKSLRAGTLEGSPFAVALLDLDGFRVINETSGHLIGDEILVEVGATLAALESNDIVARLAGDDFGIVIHGLPDAGELPKRLRRYSAAFDSPFHTGDREGKNFLPVAASIGVAQFPDHGANAEDLLNCASVALDAAKERGGGTTVVYADSMAQRSSDRYKFRSELAAAFDTDAFFLEYQPTFDLATRELVGAEALVRWNHPVRGLLPPAQFVDFAERSGFASKLARWVLNRLCADLDGNALPVKFRCYFNLAAHLLDDPAFLAELEAQLARVPHLATRLGIEITESEAMQNAERTVAALQHVRGLGLRVAIDDFGTGYSSMAYLKRFPIDVLKIDRSFVSGLPDDEKDAALNQMFLRLTEQFDFTSLAEGIETEAQADWLLKHGCALGQGFLVSRPVPIAALLNRFH